MRHGFGDVLETDRGWGPRRLIGRHSCRRRSRSATRDCVPTGNEWPATSTAASRNPVSQGSGAKHAKLSYYSYSELQFSTGHLPLLGPTRQPLGEGRTPSGPLASALAQRRDSRKHRPCSRTDRAFNEPIHCSDRSGCGAGRISAIGSPLFVTNGDGLARSAPTSQEGRGHIALNLEMLTLSKC